MSNDEFTKLFKYVEKRFDAMEKRFDKTASKKQVDVLMGAVEGLAGQLKDYHEELVMLAHKVDRLERWVTQIATKTGIKLEY